MTVKKRILSRIANAGPRGAKVPFGMRKRVDKEAIPAALQALLDAGDILPIQRGKHTYYIPPPDPLPPEPILEAIRDAKKRGRTEATLARHLKVPPPALKRGLEILRDRPAIVEVARKTRLYWVATEFAPPSLESVSQRVIEILEAEPELLFALRDLRRPLRRSEKTFVPEALYWLEDEGRVEKRLTKERHKPYWMLCTPTPAKLEPARIHSAYQALRERTQMPFVEIAALRTEAGVDLASLQAWLLEGCSSGQVLATGTNLAILSPESRQAAISWGGERCALVKLTATP